MGSSSTRTINSWETLPIGIFQKLSQLNKTEAGDDRPYEIIAILNNLTLEQVYDMKLEDVHQLMNNTSFLYNKPKVRMPKKQYTINNKVYNVFLNEKDITVSQYLDFQQLAANVDEHLAQFLSIFFIPEGKTYNNGYNIEFVQNELSNYLDVETALSLTRFFFHKLRKSMRHTLLYSQALITMAKMKAPTKELKEQMKIVEKVVTEMPTLDTYGLD